MQSLMGKQNLNSTATVCLANQSAPSLKSHYQQPSFNANSPRAIWRIKNTKSLTRNSEQQKRKIELYQQLEFSNKADWSRLRRPKSASGSHSEFLFVDLSPKKVGPSGSEKTKPQQASSASESLIKSTENFVTRDSATSINHPRTSQVNKNDLNLNISTVSANTPKEHNQNNASTVLKSPLFLNKNRNDHPITSTPPASAPASQNFFSLSPSPKCIWQNGRAILQSSSYHAAVNQPVCPIRDEDKECNDAKDAFAKIIKKSVSSIGTEPFTSSIKSGVLPSIVNNEGCIYNTSPLRSKSNSFASDVALTPAKPKSLRAKSYSGKSSKTAVLKVTKHSKPLQRPISSGVDFSRNTDNSEFRTPIKYSDINTNTKALGTPVNKKHNNTDEFHERCFSNISIGSPISLDFTSIGNTIIHTDPLGAEGDSTVYVSDKRVGPTNCNTLVTPPSPPLEANINIADITKADTKNDKLKPGVLNFSDDFFQLHSSAIHSINEMNMFDIENTINDYTAPIPSTSAPVSISEPLFNLDLSDMSLENF